ncbi:MAG TPA: Trk system potassium transporter TrkA [Clostridiaceae bacterium]|nr:Trk system potassium transporter TrkA [Clostridiaceae bacterium]
MKIMIVGAGKLGYKLANSLSSGNTDITVIDTSADVLNDISEQLDVMVIQASGTQISTLKELNIHTYDFIIAVTDNDETNIVISNLAKKLGCKKAIARVRNPEYNEHLNFLKASMDIDHVINPDLATANEFERYLFKSNTFYSGDFANGKVTMVDLNVANLPGFAGKKLMELDIIKRGLLIVAISRNGEIIIPNGSTKILDNDTLYIIGKSENINSLSAKSNSLLPTRYIKKVMILGGGKIGYYLTKKLTGLGVAVKIIEIDMRRCEYLSENLPEALVIHGDGSNMGLLEEEDISKMDAFIGATGFDEENLLMTLLAKQAGVKKVIAKVSKPNYVKLIEKLGVDIALSPIDITVSEVLKHIRGENTVSVSLLLGGQAEITEVIAEKKMSIVGKPLYQANIPKGIIVATVVHEGQVIIPNGKTVIHENDRMIIFSLSSQFTPEILFK